LVLDAFDLHTFTQRNPEVCRQIEEIAAKRAEFRAAPSGDGDLIEAELDDSDIPPRDELLGACRQSGVD
jgi:voltage-gated potassium channel